MNFARFLRAFFAEHFQVQVTACCALTLFYPKYVVQSICYEKDRENIHFMTV